MDHLTILVILALILGFYTAWNIGANDVANAMGTSVGSGALTLRRAVILAALLEFSGAFLVGAHVSETIEKGIVDPNIFANEPMTLVYGMLASLLAAGVWLQFASYCGWPVSTTHTIIGAVIGFGVVVGGFEAIQWGEVGTIVLSWIISPLMGGTIAYLLFNFLRMKIFYATHPVEEAKKWTPFLVFFVFLILSLAMFVNGLKNLHLHLSFLPAVGLSICIGLVAAGISRLLVKRIHFEPTPVAHPKFQNPQVVVGLEKASKHLTRAETASTGEIRERISELAEDVKSLFYFVKEKGSSRVDTSEHRATERIFGYLQILSACFMAFAHGANDVSNAIGPLAAALEILRSGKVALESAVPPYILALGGVGIVIGLATWGWRVIETVGKKITELTPTRGFCAELSAAITIIFASKLGLPISTTHTLVGAVLGVGLARGIGALNLTVIRDIVISWVVTVPIGALLAVAFFYTLRFFFA